MRFRKIVLVCALLFSFASNAQTPCEAGFAGVFPCENIDLMSQIPASDFPGSPEMNDIWGWVDPLDNKEYVMMGMTNGTSFIDISDPVNPVYLGYLPTHTSNSAWRDIKVYSNHAFIVSEAGGHGMQVFDLTRLRTVPAPPETFTEDAHYNLFGNAHNIAINEATAKAYVVGSGLSNGGLHIVDISNPLAPAFAGDYALDGYTHDAQIVIYNGPDATYAGDEIAFNCNEDALTIANVTDPTDAQTISISGYTGASYAHQGWLTPDQRYFLLGDELDENNGVVSNTTTYIWDVQDLDNPILIGTYVSALEAIDHNLYNDGNLCYQSNYRAGLRILDITDVANANLTEVASFDLYPSSNSAAFNGSWSNYPYFPSGVVAVSHIENGLFLLKPRFVDVSITDDLVCYTDDAVFDIDVHAGFDGPVTLAVESGLPPGASATFSANGVSAGSYTLTLSNLPAAGGVFDLVLSGTGTYFSYTDSVTFTVYDCANDVLGCTDPGASNYNPAATIDDGSCIFPCYTIDIEILTDCWGDETSWDIVDENGTTVAAGPASAYGNQTTYNEIFCLEAGCYDITIFDSFGDGMDGISSGCATDGNYTITDDLGNVLVQMGAPNFGSSITHNICLPLGITGCLDTSACNYDSTATIDDGTCTFPGCNDSTACNFDSAAGCDDGSCEFLNCAGCMNTAACNYDSTATIDNGSCILPDGCTNIAACNYDSAALCDDGSCEFTSCAGCMNSMACNYDSTATIDDGSCESTSCAGCTTASACNYDSTATIDDGSCEFTTCAGCMNTMACNYDSSATLDDNSCTFAITYYADVDSDGFGDIESTMMLCDPMAGFVLDNTDCDDTNEDMYPGAPGTAEGIDNNCNGTIDPSEELPGPCLGDFNNDGIIATPDLLILLGDFGCLSGCVADLDSDTFVTTADLLFFLGLFGNVCP